jgi:hypothetical protein
LNEIGLKPIDDEFPDAQLFNVDVIHPEYADKIHYLDKGVFSQDCSEKQNDDWFIKLNFIL